jgi:hypothetical protein
MTTRRLLAALVLILAAAPALAHHSFGAEFDATKRMTISGAVTKVEWTNPHIWFFVDVTDPNGRVANWALEMGSPNALMRAGWTRTSLKLGDVVAVDGFLHRSRRNVGNARVVTLAATGKRLLDPASGGVEYGSAAAAAKSDAATAARIPRTAAGKPDLSGTWKPTPDPTSAAGGIEGLHTPRYLLDIMIDVKPSEVPLTPWAAAIYKQRNANLRRDNPLISCLPAGVPRLNAYTHPYKIVQTPTVIVILYESLTMFRQIFIDGRALPKDPQPSWFGYSVGRWDGDVLVVESAGFNDRTWLDGSGHPHSDQMRLTERFHRTGVGTMNIEVVINDPKAYTRPVRYVQPQTLLPNTELIEYVCENAKAVGP